MNSPADSLYDDITLIDRALEPFTSPQVEERPGLRWMRRTLVERRSHIVAKIAEAERSSLIVRVRSVTGGSSIRVTTVAALLGALQRALDDAASAVAWPAALPDEQRRAALALEIGDATTTDEHWEVALHRRAGPLEAQTVTADGEHLAVDVALVALLDGLGHDGGDVGRMALAQGLSIDLTASPAFGDGRAVSITPQTAVGADG